MNHSKWGKRPVRSRGTGRNVNDGERVVGAKKKELKQAMKSG